MDTTKDIQNKIADLLTKKLDNHSEVNKEWNVTKDHKDEYNNKIIYAPRVDIAVGPFRIESKNYDETKKIEDYCNSQIELIDKIKDKGEIFNGFKYNSNPRCFIAIEIEKSGSKKHHLGDIANASILGKIGLVVPITEQSYKTFQRIMKYIEFAHHNQKISNNIFTNIILIKANDLIELLEE